MFTALYDDKFPERKIVSKVFNAHNSPGDTDRKHMRSALEKIKTYLSNGNGIYQSASKKMGIHLYLPKTLPSSVLFNAAAF